MPLLWIVIPLFFLYSTLIIYYWRRWLSVPGFTADGTGNENVSVIIPARNEEENIGYLLDALMKQDYPADLTQIIVIDDHSEDRTADIVRGYERVQLLQLDGGEVNSYKKQAIEAGIAAAKGTLVITTDADCQPPQSWIRTLVAFRNSHDAAFVAAPVVIHEGTSLVQVFQAIDFMVLQGITAAVVSGNRMSMCNGANIAYDRQAFYEVNGFRGIDQIASGDDMLLMHKIAVRYPGRVCYLKSQQALVATQAVTSWKAFFNQRIRWASKARLYDDKRILPVLLLVYLHNLSFLILAIAGFWQPDYWLMGGILWILKTLVELPFFASLATYFGKERHVKWFFFFQPLHIAYTIISGLFGQIGRYEWKGRKVK